MVGRGRRGAGACPPRYVEMSGRLCERGGAVGYGAGSATQCAATPGGASLTGSADFFEVEEAVVGGFVRDAAEVFGDEVLGVGEGDDSVEAVALSGEVVFPCHGEEVRRQDVRPEAGAALAAEVVDGGHAQRRVIEGTEEGPELVGLVEGEEELRGAGLGEEDSQAGVPLRNNSAVGAMRLETRSRFIALRTWRGTSAPGLLNAPDGTGRQRAGTAQRHVQVLQRRVKRVPISVPGGRVAEDRPLDARV